MKILIISPSLDPSKNVSGISSVVSNILKFGKNQYIHFELGSMDERITDNILKKGLRLFHAFYRYVLLIIKIKPDLVHMNVPADMKGVLREFVILKINKLFNKKVIIHLHGGEYLMKTPPNKLFTFLFKYILKKGDKVIVLSEVERDSLGELYDFSGAKILYNGVDTNKPDKIVKTEKTDILNILFLGRIEEPKGILDLITAFNQLYKEIRFKFILCGIGPLCKYTVDTLSLLMKSDFSYRGVVFGIDKEKAIVESDIFLLPSHFEGLPMSMLEVMAAEVVPVVSNVGSIPNVVKNEENGMIIEKNNPNDIYIKLKKLLENPEKMTLLSANARKTVVEKYDVRLMVEELENIYTDIF